MSPARFKRASEMLSLTHSRSVIPTALTTDRSPRSGGDGGNAVVVVCEECPGVAGLVEDVVVTVEDGDREFVATQIFPDVFDRVEFGCVGRQRDQRDVVRNDEIFGDVITGAIEDEGSVAARRNPPADLRQMQGHDLGVGGWDDERRRDAALRTDGAEDVGPFVALIAPMPIIKTNCRPHQTPEQSKLLCIGLTRPSLR